eukprot:TRINITY_DN93022_c0_g1_i1.p1 TRINITY_DN93022_c0_g1~~TRINITY_DN93022_c0_g1_i1.p1  ORF type:complete len:2197 (-),score=654.97 TRINITY_DN93022_c0_g1_i1:112-6702(-)
MQGQMPEVLPPAQELLRQFLRQRFQSEPEAASFLGGADGIDAVLGPDEFSRALRLSGYGRPAEPLFAHFAKGQSRLSLKQLLKTIGLPEEPELASRTLGPAQVATLPPEADVASLPDSRAGYPVPIPPFSRNATSRGEGAGSVFSDSLRSQMEQGPARSAPTSTDQEATLPIPSRAVAELERELAAMKREVASLNERTAAASSVTPGGDLSFAKPSRKPDDMVLQEAATLRAEGADLRTSLTEALRLLADERKERLNDRAEATRRHKELQLWAEDRIRNVEHLASEGRQCTTEVRAAVQEALQLGELSEFRALGALAEESRSREIMLQREQQVREMVASELENRFRKMLSEERAARFQESATLQEHLGRVEDNLSTEHELQGKKLADMTARLDEAFKRLEGERESRQVQFKQLTGRQDDLKSNFADGTREIRDIEDDQQRRVIGVETSVQTLNERLESELRAFKQSMLELRQQLHDEVSQREDNMSKMRLQIDDETKTRTEAVDRNLQLREDVELRLERAFRGMLHEERRAREEAHGLLEQRAAALQQEVNFEKAKAAAQGRELSHSMTQLKDALGSESVARRDEVAVAVKSVQDMADNFHQGSALRDDAEHRLMQQVANLEAAVKAEAAARQSTEQRGADELAEARLLISKEVAKREEFEALLARRMDEEKAMVEESLQKLQSNIAIADAAGWGPEKLKSMLQEERQGREHAIQRLEAMISKSDAYVGEERSMREDQHNVTSSRLSQIHTELEDVRQRAREALNRCEEIHNVQELFHREKSDRQQEATGTELSLKELAVRIDQLQQAGDSRDRVVGQKLAELVAAIENEVQERTSADSEIMRQHATNHQEVPAALASERRRTEDALSKLEEVLRQEDSEERQRREEAVSALETRWQQLREATDDAISRRLEQHGNVAMELNKVAENLGEESRQRQRAHQALTSDFRRFQEEAHEESSLRRQTEEGLREQLGQVLRRIDQAQENLSIQDSQLGGAIDELRKSVLSEATTREAVCDQLRQDLQHDSLAKEELISGANKSFQRATAKMNEELRSAIRGEAQDREELRLRVEQHLVEVRQAINDTKSIAAKNEVDIGERVRIAAEALGDDARTRKEKDDQVQQALESLRRSVSSESTDRRSATEGLAGRLQHLEAATSDQVAYREEAERRTARELVNMQARLQEEKAVREESLARLDQHILAEAAAREDAVQREAKLRDEMMTQAANATTRALKSETAAREEDNRSTAGKIQQLKSDHQSERDERSRLIRDLNAHMSKLQRLQAEEEDARSQDSERLGTALESVQEAVRGLKQSGEETLQRQHEAADELKAMIARESAARAAKHEAVDSSVRDLRTLIAAEMQQREAAIQGVSDALAIETQVREETTGRERRAIEEDVARAVRDHRKGREEEERKTQERLIEMAASIADEREQRVEALRVERLKTDDLKEELLNQRKLCQRELDKMMGTIKRVEDADGRHVKDTEAKLGVLSKWCEELSSNASQEVQKTEQVCRALENRATEVEATLRQEVRERREIDTELRSALDAEVSAREEAVGAEKRAREAGDLQQDELCKAAAAEERSQRQLFMEHCSKDLATIRVHLAEEAARRDDEKGQNGLTLQKIRSEISELASQRMSDTALTRESCDQLRNEIEELGKQHREDAEKIETSLAAERAKTEGTARIAREQAVSLEGAIQGIQEDLVREVEDRGEACRRLEARIAEERRLLETANGSQARAYEEALRSLEETFRQRSHEEARKSKTTLDRLSTQMSALVEDVEKARALQPEQAKEFARNLAQLDRRLGAEEIGRQQASVTLQRTVDALRDELLGEARDRRQQIGAAAEEVQTLARSSQQRDDKAEVLRQQLISEMSELRDRLSREVRARESALLQLESRAASRSTADDLTTTGGYQQAVPSRSAAADPGLLAVNSERWRQAEEEMERTRTGLAYLKTEAASLSKAMAGLDERCESVKSAVTAVQSTLSEVQQRQAKTAEVDAQVAQAREELRRESQERKAEGSQISARLVEHAERLEWAEQQRLKAENALAQESMETKAELKREERDREEGITKVVSLLREETARREEGLEREARMRLEGEERAAQALQAAIREERRLRGQAELRLEDRALMGGKPGGGDKAAGVLMNIPSTALEEQLRLKQTVMELQARLTSSEVRQKSAEERTVNMFDVITNALMPGQSP